MQTTKTKGCGCGGNCGGGCGCKPAELPPSAPAPCSPCETAAFIRPRFFAGQLLTEDDLEALIDYTVAKNRFHNAKLFGAGVVCGLEVQCGPCDSTKLVVEPGYALDCCGNDLVLTCERTLDLAPMIRALQIRLKGGVDCTDPCLPTTQQPADQKTDPTKPTKYCLYAVYGERFEQPVMPYPVGDDCTAGTCEPTRVVEGVTFELRCYPPAKGPDTLCDAQQHCRDLADKQGELFEMARAAAYIANQPRFSESEGDGYDELRDVRPAAIEASIASLSVTERFTVRYQVLMRIGTLLARAHHTKRELGFDPENVVTYGNTIAEHIAKTEAAEAATYLERVFALKLAEAWHARTERQTLMIQQFAEGRLWHPDITRAVHRHLEITVDKLKKLGGCLGRVHTDCSLREAIENFTASFDPDDEDAEEELQKLLNDSVEIVKRFFADCECAAFNPPCEPCTDTGVLLACFDVDRCKVVKICNTVRRYVLAPTTLRYWGYCCAPDMSCCCKEPCEEREPPPKRRERRQHSKRLDAAQKPGRVHERLCLEPFGAMDDTAALYEEIAEMRRRIDHCERRLSKKGQH